MTRPDRRAIRREVVLAYGMLDLTRLRATGEYVDRRDGLSMLTAEADLCRSATPQEVRAAADAWMSTTAQREKQAREAALEQSRQGFDQLMAESDAEMVAAIRAESRDYTAEDMEPDPNAGFDDVDMSDLPSPDLYGVHAWGRVRQRRLEQQISDTTTAAIRAEMASRRPSTRHVESYTPAPVADDGELWGADLIAEALRAEG